MSKNMVSRMSDVAWTVRYATREAMNTAVQCGTDMETSLGLLFPIRGGTGTASGSGVIENSLNEEIRTITDARTTLATSFVMIEVSDGPTRTDIYARTSRSVRDATNLATRIAVHNGAVSEVGMATKKFDG